MRKINLILFLLILSFLTGCLAVDYLNDWAEGKEEGLVFNAEFRAVCNPKAWENYPVKSGYKNVKKSRNVRTKTGSYCEKDIVWPYGQICEDTYTNKKEYYYVNEYSPDINQGFRYNAFKKCVNSLCQKQGKIDDDWNRGNWLGCFIKG